MQPPTSRNDPWCPLVPQAKSEREETQRLRSAMEALQTANAELREQELASREEAWRWQQDIEAMMAERVQTDSSRLEVVCDPNGTLQSGQGAPVKRRVLDPPPPPAPPSSPSNV